MQRLLPDALSDRLREMIVEGELSPGEKINERELCESFGVSRTPLREAVQALAKEGLIQITPRRGARVAPMTVEDLDEVFPIMGALESLAGELACARIAPNQVSEIRVLHNAMVTAYERGDRHSYFHLNEEIHDRIFKAAGNQTLIQMRRGLAARVRRARFRANLSAARWKKAVSEHEEIVAALEARDGPRLSRLLRDHLAGKLDTVRAAIRAEMAEREGAAD
ncbi:GntR family transcriptional regulator [Limibaculum sp. M0105]|uniref:GntR family transcriptional regulator n=2 Tax=Thermohalobaculum xanthum TaxID=2753746 RepID=A0A8J7SFC7_9RHOB|nr:GntR family transcriptional regulator [Thermohalobaculum xanthum]